MTYTLQDILNSILTAVQDILGYVASAIADNAETIASVVVLGALTLGIVRYGSDIFSRITGFLSGLM